MKTGKPILGNEIGPFPDRPPPRSDRPPATIANIEHLLNYAGIRVRYNEVSKRDEIEIPNRTGSTDNVDNVTLTFWLLFRVHARWRCRRKSARSSRLFLCFATCCPTALQGEPSRRA